MVRKDSDTVRRDPRAAARGDPGLAALLLRLHRVGPAVHRRAAAATHRQRAPAGRGRQRHDRRRPDAAPLPTGARAWSRSRSRTCRRGSRSCRCSGRACARRARASNRCASRCIAARLRRRSARRASCRPSSRSTCPRPTSAPSRWSRSTAPCSTSARISSAAGAVRSRTIRFYRAGARLADLHFRRARPADGRRSAAHRGQLARLVHAHGSAALGAECRPRRRSAGARHHRAAHGAVPCRSAQWRAAGARRVELHRRRTHPRLRPAPLAPVPCWDSSRAISSWPWTARVIARTAASTPPASASARSTSASTAASRKKS